MNAILPNRTPPVLNTGGAGPATPTIGLYEAWRLIVRRKWTLIAIVALFLGAGIAWLSHTKPLYTATATVMLDPRQERVVNIDSVLSNLTDDASMVDSELEVVRSRALARKVIEQSGLLELAEFNPAVEGKVPLKAQAMALLRDGNEWLHQRTGFALPLPAAAPAEPAADPLTGATDLFEERLGVTALGRSRVMAISFSSHDPDLAARIANRVAEAYMLQQIQAKFDVTQKATNWLNTRVDELRAASEAASRAVEDYRSRSGLVRGENTLLISEQISRLSADLITARSNQQAAQSRLDAIQAAVKRDGPKAVLNFYDSPTLVDLRRAESELQRTYARLSNELGPKHPQVMGARDQLDAVGRRIAVEAEEAIARARNDADVARKRVEATQTSLESLKNDMARLSGSEVQLKALEQEASAARTIYETFLNRLKQTEQLDFAHPESWMVSKADVPTDPSSPKKMIVLPAVLLLGALGGLLVIFGAELFETGIRSLEEVEEKLEIPALGMVPAQHGWSRRSGAAAQIERQPGSVFAEAHRSILTSILVNQRIGAGARVMLLTSSLPGEGKTTSVMALAKIAARNGYRTLVIDADLHRQGLSVLLHGRDKPGVGDYLQGTAELDAIIHDDGHGLHAIMAGGKRPEEQQMLRSPKLAEMIDTLRTAYDLILIDTPPVLPVSDVKILIHHADDCIHVVRWRKTRARTAAFAVKELQQAGATVQGAILSQVDTRQHAQHTYSDAERYSKECRVYYGSR